MYSQMPKEVNDNEKNRAVTKLMSILNRSMDYFYATPFKNNLNQGLWDTYARIKYSLNKKIAKTLNYHYFVTDVGLDGIKRTLGSEIDYSINIRLMKDVIMSAGYSFMLGTSGIDAVKGGNHDS